MKREGQQTAPGRGTRRSRQRRRRGLKKIILGRPSEVTADYPGFFVLPRAGSPTHTSPGKHPTRHAWWARCKLTVVLVLLFGGFVGTVAYFFVQVAPELAEPYPVVAPFVSVPSMLPTNSDAGLGRN